ncbi:38359_t:CDS:2 [Gigaspora margarita]|uniref:38359_t:CDS:1 n=1 Tax=Gigaspora margarita TaxID=4874 RepID=A0ABN7U4U3_GIGMA|nr:38359_t:CDS:2 [Gigaspora margarita]
MTAFANTIGKGKFERAIKANHQSPACQLELACTYMKDNA